MVMLILFFWEQLSTFRSTPMSKLNSNILHSDFMKFVMLLVVIICGYLSWCTFILR